MKKEVVCSNNHSRKYGVETDEADNEVYYTAKELYEQQEAEDWTTEKLLEKYENLRSVTLKNIPNLWFGLEFALSIKSILNIKDCTLPFAGILLGPASSLKTVIIELFRGYKHTFYTDNFSPRAFVSHISGKTEAQLRKDDLLPKMKNKYFMTPELSPTFSSRDDDLLQLLGIITRVVDGQGYESDTGACGHRGYDENIMFAWLGAAVDIPYKVHKLLGTLGPKLYFFRLSRVEESEDDYYDTRNQSFNRKKEEIRTALVEYLTYFDLNPEAEINIQKEEEGLPKITMDVEKDEELADRVIIRVAKLLAHLRAIVPTWETRGTQGAEYAYGLAMIEVPSRAITQLRNLARGHALSQGRKYFTLDDIPIVIHTAFSTATMERVRIFELLIANHGSLTTTEIIESLNTTPPTARRTMTELKATGLVHMDTGEGQIPSRIRLKPEFDWFLTYQFQELKEYKDLQKEKYPPEKEQQKASISLPISLLLYDYTINKKVSGSFCGGENSFYKSRDTIEESSTSSQSEPVQPQPQIQIQMKPPERCTPVMTPNGYLVPSAIIRETRASGSQILLLRNPIDFLLQTVHPGIRDNSLQIEYVTSKTRRKLLYLERRPYYYSCYHCYDVSKATFDSLDEYERHIVNGHKPRTVGYPGAPDIEKLEVERIRRKQGRIGRSKLSEMASTNEAGKGLFGDKEEDGK